MWIVRWIVNEKYSHLLDLLSNTYDNNSFLNLKEDTLDDGPSDRSYTYLSNRLNDDLSNSRDNRV